MADILSRRTNVIVVVTYSLTPTRHQAISDHNAYWNAALQWRHNERQGVSNQRRLDCLLYRLFSRRKKNPNKHQSSPSLAFVREIHRWPVNYPHKWPVTRKMFPFDDVVMRLSIWQLPLRKQNGFRVVLSLQMFFHTEDKLQFYTNWRPVYVIDMVLKVHENADVYLEMIWSVKRSKITEKYLCNIHINVSQTYRQLNIPAVIFRPVHYTTVPEFKRWNVNWARKCN